MDEKLSEPGADAGAEVPLADLREDDCCNNTILILLLLLLFAVVIWVYKRRRSVVEAKDLMASNDDEMRHYRMLFDQCDANGSGHITTTELHQAFKTLNVTAAVGAGDGRLGRQISILDVEKLRKKVDVDKNILIEFPEFVNIFKLERLDFAEKLLRDADAKGMKEANYDEVMESLKKAGFAANTNWANFIKQYEKSKENQEKKVNYEHLLQQLELAVTGQ